MVETHKESCKHSDQIADALVCMALPKRHGVWPNHARCGELIALFQTGVRLKVQLNIATPPTQQRLVHVHCVDPRRLRLQRVTDPNNGLRTDTIGNRANQRQWTGIVTVVFLHCRRRPAEVPAFCGKCASVTVNDLRQSLIFGNSDCDFQSRNPCRSRS